MPIVVRRNQVENLLTNEVIFSIIQTLYRGDYEKDDITILVDKLPGRTRGLHNVTWLRHTITLDFKKIKNDFETGYFYLGGNRPAPTLEMAAAAVLAHETQHANQNLLHRPNEKFYRAHRYRTRGCEIEARAFADSNRAVLAKILNWTDPGAQKPEGVKDHGAVVKSVLEALQGAKKTTVDEVVSCLKALRANNPKNVERAVLALREEGLTIM